MSNSIDIDIKAGHLTRYIEAIRDGLTVMIEKMDIVKETYCEKCGCALEMCEKQPTEGDYVLKWCPKCIDGERYVFAKGR